MKKNAQKNVLIHTKAKLSLYEEYLKRYLRILALNPFVECINLYDLFCGTGIYDDGKEGSPIIALRAIKSLRKFLTDSQKNNKTINLIVNDGEEKHIKNVKTHLTDLNIPQVCNIYFGNYDSKEAINRVINKINKQNNKTKNLIFIDPYGYKEIHKADIYKLLKRKNSEILLFLPISFMYRFTKIALNDYDNIAYDKLRKFIYEFFEDNHPVRAGINLKAKEFIKFVEESLTFNGEFYTASFYIQRDSANYFAVFFITPNIYGLEKFLEVEWTIDSDEGSGFRNDQTIYLFQNENFENNLIKYIKENIVTNLDLYLYVLKQKYKIKHAADILKKLRANGKLEVIDIETGKLIKQAFYLNYEQFRTSNPKVRFKIIEK